MKTRLIALLTTGMMLASSAALLPVRTGAAEDPIFGTLPDWVPTDFADALAFYNGYGKTHVADGIICLVRPAVQFKKDDYHVSLSGSMAPISTRDGSKPQFYELEIPEKPDPNDAEALAAYETLCQKLGIPADDYSFFESYPNRKTQPAFQVELYRVFEGYDLTIAWTEKEGDETKTTETFSFENKDGTIVETDKYSWLPDSLPEFNEFVRISGKASAHGNAAQGVYVTYASSVNASTGASLKMEQEGDCEVKEVMRSNCTPFELMPEDGSGTYEVILYAPTADGIVNMKWTVGQEWSDEEPFEVTEGCFEFADNCTTFTNRTMPKQPETIITMLDADTGEVIDFDNMNKGVCYIKEEVENEPYAGELFYMRTNPCSFKGTDAYDRKAAYYVELGGDYGWYQEPQFEITSEEDDTLRISCRVKWNPSGDANSDGVFGLSDIILLQKHLLGVAKGKIADVNAMDFCRDHELDIFDLGMMKRTLFNKKQAGYVEPEIPVKKYGSPFYVLADRLNLYIAPDKTSEVLAVIPHSETIYEFGYQKDSMRWLFTQYRGISGWIRMVDDEGNPTVNSWSMVDKPVIYLYPTEETDVHVELTLTESELATTYPKYNNGWDVVASPDGSLLNKTDGTHHRYLFWDSTNCRTRFDFSKGFCVAGADTERFLKEKLTYMGLTEEEMNEFIVYWLPRMEHNAYNLIAFQGDAYTNSAKLDITPAPDSECRVFMAYVPLESAVEIEPQTLPTFERKGFAVVEWGGTEIAS